MSDIVLYDSQTTFQGGMQNGFDAAQVAEHQYFRGINVQCREGIIDSRPSFRKLNLDTTELESDTEAKQQAQQDLDDAQAAYDVADDALNNPTTGQQAIEDTAYAAYQALVAVTEGLVDDYNTAKDAVPITIEDAARTALTTAMAKLIYYDYDHTADSVWVLAYAIIPQWIPTIASGYSQAQIDAITDYLKDGAYPWTDPYYINTATPDYRGNTWAPWAAEYEDGSGNKLHEVALPWDESCSITGDASGGGDIVTFTTTVHPWSNGDLVSIRGDDYYDGDYVISNVTDAYHFDITISGGYVGGGALGNCFAMSDTLADRWSVLDELEAAIAGYVSDQASYALYQAEVAITATVQAALDDAQTYLDQMQGIYDATFDGAFIFNYGKFQGAKKYNTRSRSYIVTVISGHIFLVNLDELQVTCLTTGITKLSQDVDRCFFCQAENYMIVQDGISLPKILEGADIRDANPDEPEIPTGTNMAYGHGRIAIQVSPKHFVMGDIFLAYEPENVLRMKETRYLNEGGGFTVSGDLGNIISLQYANVSDTSTGDGPLLAICENGFSTFAVNNPRAQWMNIGIQKIQLLGTGIVGPIASCNINEDILYRSHEGIRSYAVGRREAASAYKYTELSREMEPYIHNDSGFDARFLSMAFFDKRMLALTAPKTVKAYGADYKDAKEAYDAAKDAALAYDSTVTDINIKDKVLAKLQAIYADASTWTPIAAPTREFVESPVGDSACISMMDNVAIPGSFTVHVDFYFDEIDDSVTIDDSAVVAHCTDYQGAGWNLGIKKSTDSNPFGIYVTFQTNGGTFAIDSGATVLQTNAYNRVSMSYDAATGDAILYLNGNKFTANGAMSTIDTTTAAPIKGRFFRGVQGGWGNKVAGVLYKAIYLDNAYADADLLALHNGLYPKDGRIFDYEFGHDPVNEDFVLDFSASQNDGSIAGTPAFSSETDPIYAKRLVSTVENAEEDELFDALMTIYENATPDTDTSGTDELIAYMNAVDDLNNEILDDVYFKGIIAFDFSLAGFTKSTSEDQYKRSTTGSYDGVWTGLLATQVLSSVIDGIKRCFAFSKLPDGQNALYEITKDVTGYDDTKKIESILELRAMPYKAEQTYVPAPFVNKKLEDITLWLTGIEDEVNMEIFVSSDVINAYTQVGKLTLLAKTSSSTAPPSVGSPQSRAMYQLKDIADLLYDATTKHPIRQGNEFQFRFVWSGKVKLRRFFTAARKITDVEGKPNIETEKAVYPVDTFDQYRYSCAE